MSESRLAAHAALQALPDDLRDVLERARHGSTYAEIATATGSTYESVRRRVALACMSVSNALKTGEPSARLLPPG